LARPVANAAGSDQIDSGLAIALLRDPETFVRTLTEKLMTYAVGRGLTGTDMPAVRTVVRDSAREQYRFSSVILEIVRSVPFQMRMKAPAGEGATSTARLN